MSLFQRALKYRRNIVKKITGIGIILLSLLALVATPALAAVTFNPDDGTGFVGKGEVQLAFGWNNAALQNNASNVTFTYVSTTVYNVTEVWATGNPDNPKSLSSHEVSVTNYIGVNGSTNSDPRQVKGQKQFTGFNLAGCNGTVNVGDVPEEDYIDWITYTWVDNKGNVQTTDELPVDGDGILYDATKKAVLKIEVISTVEGLYANYGGVSVLIQATEAP